MTEDQIPDTVGQALHPANADFEPGGKHYGKVAPIEAHPGVEDLEPTPLHTYKPKGLRIVEECERTGEPYFVFRAKDVLSIMVLVEYQELIDTYRPSNHIMGGAVADARAEFVDWMDNHPGEVHLPD